MLNVRMSHSIKQLLTYNSFGWHSVQETIYAESQGILVLRLLALELIPC
jgi:hypothetical protein